MDQTQMMTIDGMPVAINGEKNLLELIRKVGVKMPTFCYHSDLSVYGACRMCMVENERGGLEAACSTPPRPGMNIRTNTERLRKYRKMILELLLADIAGIVRHAPTMDIVNYKVWRFDLISAMFGFRILLLNPE